jgi:hypothetical protein
MRIGLWYVAFLYLGLVYLGKLDDDMRFARHAQLEPRCWSKCMKGKGFLHVDDGACQRA